MHFRFSDPLGWIISSGEENVFIEWNEDTADRAKRRPSYAPVINVEDGLLITPYETFNVIGERIDGAKIVEVYTSESQLEDEDFDWDGNDCLGDGSHVYDGTQEECHRCGHNPLY